VVTQALETTDACPDLHLKRGALSDDSMEKLTNTHTGKQHTTTSTQAFMQDCNGQNCSSSTVPYCS